MPLKIDKKVCDRCGTCISVCPCNALLLTDELSVIRDQCTQCGTCVAICPVGALEIEKL
ncbi:MAG: 4Fe-4S binding protein [Chitinispirillaceae bacterium]|nr:4Fe-4S binding protein [Chitinispirillaceae bacterium]